MRSLAQLPEGTPVEISSAHPDGAIINETTDQEGTPVVREVYTDVLSNLYKIVRLSGSVLNAEEDSEDNGYQLVDAFQKFTNRLNDIEQILNYDGTTYSIALNIALLPNKYFVFVTAAADYVPGKTIKGSASAPVYNLISTTGFKAQDEVLLILDTAGVRAISLGSSASDDSAFTPFGTPLAYNDSTKMWYQSQGVLFSDAPESYDLQGAIRQLESDASVLVYEMVVIGLYLLCLTYRPATKLYKFYRFTVSNLSIPPTVVAVTGPALPSGSITNDYQPFFFTDGTNLFISNSAGAGIDNQLLKAYAVNLPAATLSGIGSLDLGANYVKSTNSVIQSNYLYVYANGIIKQYSLLTGQYVFGVNIPGNLGVLVRFKQAIYYVGTDVAKKWQLPVYTA